MASGIREFLVLPVGHRIAADEVSFQRDVVLRSLVAKAAVFGFGQLHGALQRRSHEKWAGRDEAVFAPAEGSKLGPAARYAGDGYAAGRLPGRGRPQLPRQIEREHAAAGGLIIRYPCLIPFAPFLNPGCSRTSIQIEVDEVERVDVILVGAVAPIIAGAGGQGYTIA